MSFSQILCKPLPKSIKLLPSLEDFVANSMTNDTPYIAVYLPGGHGAMLGLPENSNLGELLRWAHRRNLFTLAICHGPAALLAAEEQGGNSTKF